MRAKEILESIHTNISVMCHPSFNIRLNGVLWTHHEKLVVIDQCLAFMGGIDLTYGRWDDHHHLV